MFTAASGYFREPIDIFHFPNTDCVMILRRTDSLSRSLRRVHADIFILACTLFNEQDKGSNLLRIMT